MPEKCRAHTIPDIAFSNLLQDLGPDVGVTLFVCRHGGGLEVDHLGDAADGCHYGW